MNASEPGPLVPTCSQYVVAMRLYVCAEGLEYPPALVYKVPVGLLKALVKAVQACM